MLLKALLTRLNEGAGANQNREKGDRCPFSRLVFEKYPGLPDLIVGLLGSDGITETRMADSRSNTSSNALSTHFQAIFPAMEIIERFGIPDSHRAIVIGFLSQHLESRVWALREKAASTLALLIDEHSIIKDIKDSWQGYWPSQNLLHGRLLCLKLIVLDCLRSGIGKKMLALHNALRRYQLP